MPLCACGCGLSLTPAQVKRGGRYATRRCSLASIPPDVRAARARAWAAAHMDELREWGSKGGRSTDTARWAALLEKWQDMAPRDALHEAYRRGYQTGYLAGARAGGRRYGRKSAA